MGNLKTRPRLKQSAQVSVWGGARGPATTAWRGGSNLNLRKCRFRPPDRGVQKDIS